QLELGLEPGQVGLGLPATPQAAGGGHQPPGNVVSALNCLEEGTDCGSFTPEQPYGPIGGALTWSTNRDASNGYEFAQTVGGRLGTGWPARRGAGRHRPAPGRRARPRPLRRGAPVRLRVPPPAGAPPLPRPRRPLHQGEAGPPHARRDPVARLGGPAALLGHLAVEGGEIGRAHV